MVMKPTAAQVLCRARFSGGTEQVMFSFTTDRLQPVRHVVDLSSYRDFDRARACVLCFDKGRYARLA
jgi:hypothetical protein